MNYSINDQYYSNGNQQNQSITPTNYYNFYNQYQQQQQQQQQQFRDNYINFNLNNDNTNNIYQQQQQQQQQNQQFLNDSNNYYYYNQQQLNNQHESETEPKVPESVLLPPPPLPPPPPPPSYNQNNYKLSPSSAEYYNYLNKKKKQSPPSPSPLPPPPPPPPPPPSSHLPYHSTTLKKKKHSISKPDYYVPSSLLNLEPPLPPPPPPLLPPPLQQKSQKTQKSHHSHNQHQHHHHHHHHHQQQQQQNEDKSILSSPSKERLNSSTRSSVKRMHSNNISALPTPKCVKPKLCKTPVLIQSASSKKIQKTEPQIATIPPPPPSPLNTKVKEQNKQIGFPPPPKVDNEFLPQLPPRPNVMLPPSSYIQRPFNNNNNNYSHNLSNTSHLNTSSLNNSSFLNQTTNIVTNGLQKSSDNNYLDILLSSPNLLTLFDKNFKKIKQNQSLPPPPPYPGVVVASNQNESKEEKLENEIKKETQPPISSSSTSSVVRYCSPQAYRFYMEQHAENIIKHHMARKYRQSQLESEMAKVELNDELQAQMRNLLKQKETNYLRLRRAKMNVTMFESIKVLGVGAFGEVNLVRKRDDTQRLYAMKILHKSDIFNRNQAAHVKAERDILAEADNEWVVKLYYSFQDEENLYFVMDYVPGGDLMSLLIKFGIFDEELAKFYIGELTMAIESVHNLGFIHRDIKPDNILIDNLGHIKLTDFGLCTGFHWTHNSKYYKSKFKF
jgi:serine/threonine-protein kinase LATS1/2